MIQSQALSFISTETTIEGIVRFSGILRLHGKIIGDVFGENDSHLIIEENGLLTGNATVDKSSILGTMQGKLVSRKTADIHSTGKLLGDVQSPSLQVHPGSMFDARVSIAALIEKPLQMNPMI